jgi:putative N6-adenine-specific DNA methylase
VSARSVKSRLTATPSVQSVSKKAIVDSIAGMRGNTRGGAHGDAQDGGRGEKRGGMQGGAHPSARMQETGPHYDVEIAIHADRASVCLDTTGPGLHKRGYRLAAGEAPLRENLAAALVLLSRWDSDRPFADPLCGSGTIAIEAALMAANIAPGISRTFASEAWPLIPSTVWKEAREQARAEERRPAHIEIEGADRDGKIIRAAGENARAAGVAEMIRFRQAPIEAFSPAGDYGCIVCNPPYGLRLGEQKAVETLYRAMGVLFRGLPTWSLFALSAREDFQKLFGARASRNRKLYNGNVRCWYYQYFGPLPGRGKRAADEG